VTTPLELIEATLGEALLQVPPLVVLNKLVVRPTQTDVIPVIGLTVGNGLTVTAVVVALQPVVLFVKVKVALPEATPVTSPELVTVAFDVLLLTHVPPLAGDN
jgi:hypothetical protein